MKRTCNAEGAFVHEFTDRNCEKQKQLSSALLQMTGENFAKCVSSISDKKFALGITKSKIVNSKQGNKTSASRSC